MVELVALLARFLRVVLLAMLLVQTVAILPYILQMT
jgi:hypothetical protein